LGWRLVNAINRCNYKIVITPSWIVGDSESGDVGQVDVSLDTFSHKCNIKLVRVLLYNLWLSTKKDTFTEKMIWQQMVN
jgi:hypothetical protein